MQTSNKSTAADLPLPLVKTDAFIAGDGKAVRDINTNLIWLNFGINNGRSFYEVMSELNTTYQNWRLPTELEVRQMWGSLFASNVCSNDPLQIFQVWGANTRPINNQPYHSWGYFLDNDGYLASASFIAVNTTPPSVDHYVTTEKLYKYEGTNTPPFNQGGTFEASTLLVKNNRPQGPQPGQLNY